MSSEGSVTSWIANFKAGDASAAQKLWERYYQRLLFQCRRHLGDAPRRVADEEDVALTAFNKLFRAIQRDQYPKLNDRNNFWRLLLAIAAREAGRQKRSDHRKKRGGGRVLGESAITDECLSSGDVTFDRMIGSVPTPEFAAIVAEQYGRLFERLDNDDLREIAQMKLEEYLNKQIADRLKYSLRTVERKLHSIRSEWSRER